MERQSKRGGVVGIRGIKLGPSSRLEYNFMVGDDKALAGALPIDNKRIDNKQRPILNSHHPKNAADSRQQQLQQWLKPHLGEAPAGQPAGSDAGFRRYFRYQLNDKTLIAMDAPPATEDCRPFIKVAGLLADAGVRVPEIIAADVEQGFMLLSDLGQHTCLDVILGESFSPADAEPLFQQAIAALIHFQAVSQPKLLPNYDGAVLHREMMLFPDWYLARHRGIEVRGEWSDLMAALFQQLIDQISSQSSVYVHRDYMPRNLMWSEQQLGVLDFQDALYGPISYDITSLFRDAFISWPEDAVKAWTQSYWQQASEAGLPVPEQFEDFYRDCDYMAVQRHLKVIGIFCRICYRDGKDRYLKDIDRFFGYLRAVAARRPELPMLATLLEKLAS